MNEITSWYKQNSGKILLMSIVFMLFIITVKIIPYVSFLFPSELGIVALFSSWYLLFSPSTRLLVLISWGILSIIFLSTYLQLGGISNNLGNFLYFELFLIFANLIKDFYKQRNNIQ